MNQEVKVSTPESLAENGVAEAPLAVNATVSNVAAAARQFAEVKGAIQLAREFPRNEVQAFKDMRRVCSRASFAEEALYAFPRGNKIVTGAGIRLVEELVRAYRNIDYGFRIMEIREDRSLVEAFAWDVENNIKARREFWVLHIRETKAGNYPVSGPRDTYELCANMAQRRVRACVEQMLPIDLLEDAKRLCKKTMEGGDGMPFEDRVREMVLSFDELGISAEMIEGHLGHSLKAMVIEQLPKLRQIFNSIKGGLARREDFFDVPPPSADIPPPKGNGSAPKADDGPASDAATEDMSEEDRAVLEKAKKKLEDKRSRANKHTGVREPILKPNDKGEVIDPNTGEVLNETPPMTEEEMAEIQAREAAEYEAEQKERAEEEAPEELPLGAPKARAPRKPRATKKS